MECCLWGLLLYYILCGRGGHVYRSRAHSVTSLVTASGRPRNSFQDLEVAGLQIRILRSGGTAAEFKYQHRIQGWSFMMHCGWSEGPEGPDLLLDLCTIGFRGEVNSTDAYCYSLNSIMFLVVESVMWLTESTYRMKSVSDIREETATNRWDLSVWGACWLDTVLRLWGAVVWVAHSLSDP